MTPELAEKRRIVRRQEEPGHEFSEMRNEQ